MKKNFITILFLSIILNYSFSQNNLNNFNFIENKGQIMDQFGHPNDQVLFIANLPNLKVTLRKEGFSYEVTKSIEKQSLKNEPIKRKAHQIETSRIDFKMGKIDHISKENEAPYISNYITNNIEITGVKSFQTIKYNNVWHNIDIEFNIIESPIPQFKYNFVLHNGANLDDIRFNINADKLPFLENSRLKINTPYGIIEEKIPESYVLDNTSRSKSPIQVNYKIIHNNTIGLDLPNKEILDLSAGKTLIIDPTPDLLWGTYVGGNNIDIGNSIATDANGNIYMAGVTASSNNISTIGVFQNAIQAFADGFVVKFNSNGGRLWGTYYGGNDATFINKVVSDNAGGAFILGDTYATSNISSTPTHQPAHGNAGGIDCFLARLNASGGRLWGTFYGGIDDDYSYGLSSDATSVYIVGETASNNNISTTGSHKPAITGGTDGFIAKFNYAGNRQWGTYFGGDGGDAVKGVAVDKNGNVCIGGTTNSIAGISTPNTHQTAISSDNDGFVAKFNNAGVRQWGTYYGGTNLDNITNVSVDTAGNVLCSGSTQSTAGISSPCVHQYYAPAYISASEAPFLININGQTGKRNWGTYFGPESTIINTLKGDKKGNVYFGGQAFNTGIGTTGAFKLDITGESDGFIAKINSNGLLEWGSYYGGDGDVDEVNDIFVDATNQLFLTGSTSSTNNIATTGAFQILNGGNPVDAFISKLKDNSINSKVPAVITSTVSIITGSCLGVASGKAIVQGGGGILPYTYLWSNGETSASANALPNGNVSVTVSDANGCFSVSTVTIPSLPTPTAYAGPDITICSGSTANLNATGGGTYLWSNGPNTAANPVQPTVLTSYRVTVTGQNGCYSVDTVVVRINQVPVANAGVDTTVCQGRSARLRATGGGTYKWSTNQTVQEIIVTPTITTTYTVTVTASNTCTATDVVVVNVIPIPKANAGTNKILCIGSSVNLIATGGTNYVWNNGNTTDTINVSPTVTTNYIVTVSTGSCFAMDTVLVEVIPLPKANAGFDQSICTGNEATLVATGGSNYLWNTGDNTATIKVKPTVTSSYVVTVYSANGCKNTDTVVVKVNPLPEAKAGLSFSVCQGVPFQLKASGGTNYEWSNGAKTDTTTIIENSFGIKNYTVTVSDGNGCSASDQISVNIQSSPVVNLVSESSICKGQNITLAAGSNASNFLWNTGATTNSITITPLTTTNYSLTVTGANGCFTVINSNVIVNQTPIADAGMDQRICLGSTANLKASGGINYLWSNGEKTADITVSPTSNTKYYVTVSNGNCSNVDSVQVSINALPIANAGTDQTICKGTSTQLVATGGTNYKWSDGNTSNPITISPTITTTYIVTVTDLVGCSAIDSVKITVNILPPANTGADQTICKGATIKLTASGGANYKWSNGVNSSENTVTPTVTSTYIVTVTDANGCKATDSVKVVVNPLPVANAGVDQSICNGSVTKLKAIGGNIYLWSNGGATDEITINPTVTTTYVVIVTDINGCKASDSVVVTVNPLPIVNLGLDTLKIPVGQTATLDAANIGSIYKWSNGATTQKIVVIEPSNQYCVTVTNNFGCQATDCIYVKFTPNAIQEIDNWAAKVFPNPANSVVNISGNRFLENAQIQLFTMDGKQILMKTFSGDTISIDINEFPNGSYQIILKEKEKTNRYSLLIQKN